MLDLIAMFLVGIILGICLTMLIVLHYCWTDDPEEYPTDDDLEQMCLFYERDHKEEDHAE